MIHTVFRQSHLICLLALTIISLPTSAAPEYTGAETCRSCHQDTFQRWTGSHHQQAMQPASNETVLGNFNNTQFIYNGITSRFFRDQGQYKVETDGADGRLQVFTIRYTFGVFPLQQYLIEMEGGRLQAFAIAWDSRNKEQGGLRWFHLYPDQKIDYTSPLHWTARDQNWNYQCAECHSTNLEKHYQPEQDRYATTWSDINVACESCHGPGSEHVAWASAPDGKSNGNNGLVVNLQGDGAHWSVDKSTQKPARSTPRTDFSELNVCARCHSRRGTQWDEYRHGEAITQTHRLATLEPDLYFADGQIKDEVFVLGSFLQSKMHAAGVTCSQCHDPHSLKLKMEVPALCSQCHTATRYDTPKHHHHTAQQAQCVDCHMPQRTYMVIDERADHSFRVPRPDLSARLNTPNACNQCHSKQSSPWAADTIQQWRTAAGNNNPLPDHFGTALQQARTLQPHADQSLLQVIAQTGNTPMARASALDHLAPYFNGSHVDQVTQQLADASPLVRAAAVRLMEAMPLQQSAQWLLTMMQDEDRSVRMEVARLLAPLSTQILPEQMRRDLTALLAEYERSIRATAERPESQLHLGLLYLNLRRLPEAEQAYQRALVLDPLFTPAYANLADFYRQTQREPESEAVLRKGLQALPDAATLHHAYGLSLVRQGKYSLALASLRKAQQLAPGNSQYGYVYAIALDSQGKTQLAVAALQTALENSPADGRLLAALAEFHYKMGQTDTALRYARQLRALNPNDPQAQQMVNDLSQPPGN